MRVSKHTGLSRMEEKPMSRDRKPLTDVSAKSSGAHPINKSAELTALLEAHSGERHAIVMQDYPDPDAISGAWAHKAISARFGIECDLIYEGRISHQENLALLHLTKSELPRYTTAYN